MAMQALARSESKLSAAKQALARSESKSSAAKQALARSESKSSAAKQALVLPSSKLILANQKKYYESDLHSASPSPLSPDLSAPVRNLRHFCGGTFAAARGMILFNAEPLRLFGRACRPAAAQIED